MYWATDPAKHPGKHWKTSEQLTICISSSMTVRHFLFNDDTQQTLETMSVRISLPLLRVLSFQERVYYLSTIVPAAQVNCPQQAQTQQEVSVKNHTLLLSFSQQYLLLEPLSTRLQHFPTHRLECAFHVQSAVPF